MPTESQQRRTRVSAPAATRDTKSIRPGNRSIGNASELAKQLPLAPIAIQPSMAGRKRPSNLQERQLFAFLKSAVQFKPPKPEPGMRFLDNVEQRRRLGWLLRHGRFFGPAKLIDGRRRGKEKQCYYNAQRLALRTPAWTYVEGFALSDSPPCPCEHGWCITSDGAVVETTWEVQGSCYFGVPLATNYLRRRKKSRPRHDMVTLDLYEQDD